MSEAGGLIVAAIIAGAVAFVSLIISKEQSISEFRQQWIDELRKDVADVIARVSGIHGGLISRKDDDEVLWDTVRADITGFNAVLARIRLRLNPNENRKKEGPATKVVLDALKELESVLASPHPQFHTLSPIVGRLVSNAQVILKENWESSSFWRAYLPRNQAGRIDRRRCGTHLRALQSDLPLGTAAA